MQQDFLLYLEKIENSLENALPCFEKETWQEDLIKPCADLFSSGGKRWRPLLLVLCAFFCKACGKKSDFSEDEIYSLTSLVEFVHTASLIHDDIEDCADFRRGKPCAYLTYGIDTALNSASYLYFYSSKVIENLCLCKNVEKLESVKNQLYSIYLNELRRLHEGQAMDIFWHKNIEIFPSIEEYTDMVLRKTGTLSSFACKIGFVCGGASLSEIDEAGKIGAKLGQGFQILDDVKNLTTGNPGKKRGDDIVEGKKSLVVLLHIEKNPSDKEKIAKLFEKAKIQGIESSAVEECICLFEKSGAINQGLEIGMAIVKENVHKLCSIFGEKYADCKESVLIKKLFEEMF